MSGGALTLRRTVVGAGAALGAVLAMAGATAFACITPATLNLSSAAGRPA